jgi:hypothetical protein
MKYVKQAGATSGEAGASAKTHKIATPASTYNLKEKCFGENAGTRDNHKQF